MFTTEQTPQKNEGVDGRQDADHVTDAALQKEEQHLVSTEQQPLKAPDGECNASAVVNEWETDVSEVKSSKENRSPILSPRDMFSSDQEVSQ